MKRPVIGRKCSIADARKNLPRLVHAAEKGRPTELTRRGKPVAVLVSSTDYERLIRDRPDFWQSYLEFRARFQDIEVDVDEFLKGTRDRSPGRGVTW